MKRHLNILMLLTAGLFITCMLASCAAGTKVEKKSNVLSTSLTKTGEIMEVEKVSKSEYLTLNGGKFTIGDTSNPNFAICQQAVDRLMKWDKKTESYYIAKDSAKKANMSEELYLAVKEFCERNNKNLEYYRSLAGRTVPNK